MRAFASPRLVALLFLACGGPPVAEATAPAHPPLLDATVPSADAAAIFVDAAVAVAPVVNDTPVSLRVVTRGPVAVAPITKQKITLAVRSEIEIANEMVPLPAPPSWVPPPSREHEVLYSVRAEPDGTALAHSRHTLVAFDKSHHVEAGLDFEPLRGDLVHPVELCCDHAVLDQGTVITSARRMGTLAIVVGSDAERGDKRYVMAVDISTATTLWKTAHDVAPEGFEIVHGHAIASSHDSGRWALDVIDLDTGRIVERVPTAHGPYRLELQADGSISGRLLASQTVTRDGKSFALEVAVTAQ